MAWRRQQPYKPGQTEAYKLSRSKIDMYVQCPRCFFLDVRLGIKRPSIPAFTLNSAVDELLKREFDSFRVKGEPHPLQTKFEINAIPAQHENLNIWRENFKGIEYLHPSTNLLLTGAIDDLWIDEEDNYIVVDYKATSKAKKVDKLEDTQWHDGYRRQMEFYQWLLINNNLKVSDTGYFVYCNGIKDANVFDAKLDFYIEVFPYKGKTEWIEPTLNNVKKCIESDRVPDTGPLCEYCPYAKQRTEMTLDALRKSKV